MKLINLIALIFIFASPANAVFSNTAKLTLRVVGEDGISIEGARVGVGFQYNLSYGTDSHGFDGVSDSDGLYTVSAKTNGFVGWNITKAGYYETRETFDFEKETPLRWEPWDPVVTSVLRKIENPVPMYIRDTRDHKLEIPEVDKDIGFDMVKFDWLPPYGKGVKADLIFHLRRMFVKWNDRDCKLKIMFSNKHDGVIRLEENKQSGSLYKLPRSAPESGYKNEITFYNKFIDGVWKSNINKYDSYILRIRTKEENGKIIQAMYGKIVGQLDFSAIGSKTAFIVMTYYLNPDGTRNLEHDPKRNLIRDPS